jgi:hypothetical protein
MTTCRMPPPNVMDPAEPYLAGTLQTAGERRRGPDRVWMTCTCGAVISRTLELARRP